MKDSEIIEVAEYKFGLGCDHYYISDTPGLFNLIDRNLPELHGIKIVNINLGDRE